MERNKLNAKRFMGTAMAALTIVAGMSGTAFAAEDTAAAEVRPAVSIVSTDGETADLDGVDVNWKHVIKISTKTEDGKLYWSLNGGGNWGEVRTENQGDGEVFYFDLLDATEAQPAVNVVPATKLETTQKDK